MKKQTFRIPYDGNLEWLVSRTILYVAHGSRAYGTHRPDSDMDFKGVTVPPRTYRDGFRLNFEQTEIRKAPLGEDNLWYLEQQGMPAEWVAEPVDAVIFDIRKFCKLAADCNPNIIEVLWTDPSDILITSKAGERLLDHRYDFLSRKVVHRFRGYAMAQLKRIKTHRKWLLDPPEKQPERADYDLPETTLIPKDQLAAAEAAVNKQIDSWEIDYGDLPESEKVYIREQIHRYMQDINVGSDEKFMAAARHIGLDENFIELMGRERRYKAAHTDWKHYQDWKKNRNEKRAALEAKFGYDTKHGLHLVRLMRMCRETLETGRVLVRRPDAEELLAIRDGVWSYETLMEWAEKQDVELLELSRTSVLPKVPNYNFLDQVCQEIVQSFDRK